MAINVNTFFKFKHMLKTHFWDITSDWKDLTGIKVGYLNFNCCKKPSTYIDLMNENYSLQSPHSVGIQWVLVLWTVQLWAENRRAEPVFEQSWVTLSACGSHALGSELSSSWVALSGSSWSFLCCIKLHTSFLPFSPPASPPSNIPFWFHGIYDLLDLVVFFVL